MDSSLEHSIILLGQDLFSMKLYWVALSALWFYEYFLTLDREIKYAWKGRKNTVFYLYLLNRYLPGAFIIITLVAYFLDAWGHDVCLRYGFMETLETMLLTFTAEAFVGLRVYALSKCRKEILYFTGFLLVWQWAIAIYAMSQSSLGTDQVALLMPRDGPPLPPLPDLPNIDPYHVCIFISVLTVTPWVEAFLCISLAFDGLAFITILLFSFKMLRDHNYQVTHLLRIIQRDGVIYFFVLFGSNLVWLLVLLHARSSLKFIHAQPAMVVSAIMINRITLNLKEACDASNDRPEGWSVKTFEQVSTLKGPKIPIQKTSLRHGSVTLTGLEDHEMQLVGNDPRINYN